ncbi:nuclease A inhibitor family protein [Pedobacter sp. D749]|uniref:nuclease A inhibitor family protein n=1 Tax=Pedobacter sp. D749 TaxID=2856523 RepID=UPI001C594941|nr:nuclease A inhibitor family protein [Pedobacter sp. D749]QXU42870.1 nuclease A inhibitor family protein [Pedobacter sp. D749]
MYNNILDTITELLSGVLYFTESENPFKVINWGKILPDGILNKIAVQYQADLSNLKQLDADAFFHHIVSKVDPSDAPMVENARKIKAIQLFLNQNLSHLQVIRIEGASRIPVLIIGYLSDGSCLAIETFAIET